MQSRLFADISSNNAEFNAAEYAAAGHLVVAIKATEGPRHNYINPYHRLWCLHAGLHHVAVIHYHFGRPDLGTDPSSEAAWFLENTLPLCGGRDYLVLDLERSTPQGFSHDPAWSRQFDQYVQEHSRFRTILYSSRSWLESAEGWLVGERKRVWDADWSGDRDYAPPGYECAMRQYTDGVYGPGPHTFAGIGRSDGSVLGRRIYDKLLATRLHPHR